MHKQHVSYRLFLCCLLWISQSAFAAFLNLPASFRRECLTPQSYSFVKPNETMPHRAKPILEKASEGVYLSVGTERGILGAIQSPKVTHLLMVDRNAHICTYNNINFSLMKLSQGNRELYLHLRQKASFQDWLTIVDNTIPLLSFEERQFVTSQKLFLFWRVSIDVENKLSVAFEAKGNPYHFIDGVHYLYEDEAFQKIYRMVAENRVDSIHLELSDAPAVRTLGREMNRLSLQVSVMDISNAWMPGYLNPGGLKRLVEVLKTNFSSNKKSFVLGTSRNFLLGNQPAIPGEGEGGSAFSRYSAYTFDYFTTNPHPFSNWSYDGVIDDQMPEGTVPISEPVLSSTGRLIKPVATQSPNFFVRWYNRWRACAGYLQ